MTAIRHGLLDECEVGAGAVPADDHAVFALYVRGEVYDAVKPRGFAQLQFDSAVAAQAHLFKVLVWQPVGRVLQVVKMLREFALFGEIYRDVGTQAVCAVYGARQTFQLQGFGNGSLFAFFAFSGNAVNGLLCQCGYVARDAFL